MHQKPRVIILHNSDGEAVEIRADDVVAVEDATLSKQARYKTRVILSDVDIKGNSVELLVKEAASAITTELVTAKAAGNWDGQ